jgi:Tfp pilus assembly protein PilX
MTSLPVAANRQRQSRDESGQTLILVLAMLILLGLLGGALVGLAGPSFTHASVVRNLNDAAAAADSGIEYGIQSVKNEPGQCLEAPPTLTASAPTINGRAVQVSCEVVPPPPDTPKGLSFILLVSTAQLGGSDASTVVSRAVLEINDRTGSATIMSWRTCRGGEC